MELAYITTAILIWIVIATVAAKTTSDFEDFTVVAGVGGLLVSALWPLFLVISFVFCIMFVFYDLVKNGTKGEVVNNYYKFRNWWIDINRND